VPYRIKQFNLSHLHGITDLSLGRHLRIYEGFVSDANRLIEDISEILKDTTVIQEEVPGYPALKRQFDFSYESMVLHEYYFGSLKRQGGGGPRRHSAFRQAAETGFGGYDQWKTDFMGRCAIRGVWAVCYLDPASGRLVNRLIPLHDTSDVTGFVPLLVLDLWEHAFLPDYKETERMQYINAYFANVDWNSVEERLRRAAPARADWNLLAGIGQSLSPFSTFLMPSSIGMKSHVT
jgi:Fe-Mn family superoxide dismutase